MAKTTSPSSELYETHFLFKGELITIVYTIVDNEVAPCYVIVSPGFGQIGQRYEMSNLPPDLEYVVNEHICELDVPLDER